MRNSSWSSHIFQEELTMNILIAADSFKGSCSAREVTDTIERAANTVLPNVTVTKIPVADGGEGTVDALVAAMNGTKVCVPVHDPLGRPITAEYGLLPDGSAVLETAAASGLTLLKPDERDVLHASTFGTGELIRHALEHGVKKIILGLGGSATTDGGAGLAQALGISFLDKAGKELAPGGVHLSELARISTDALLKEAAECEFVIACDVKNRLCGSNGAAAIFGPQKGATPEQVRILDAALSHYASILNDQLTCNAAETDGSGAAGGLLCGILPYFPVTICSGIDLVLDLTDFDEHVKHADLIITGEGRIDYQSALGKVPVGVASRAKKIRNVPVVAIAGAKGDGCETLYKFGIDAIFDTVPGIMSLEAAMEHAKENLEQTAENVLRLFFAGQENRLR